MLGILAGLTTGDAALNILPSGFCIFFHLFVLRTYGIVLLNCLIREDRQQQNVFKRGAFMAFPERHQNMGEQQQPTPPQRSDAESSQADDSLLPVPHAPLRLVRFDGAATSADAHEADTEADLRAAFRRNHEHGLELLFRRYHAPLCNHAVRIVYARAAAEDIVSDVFLNFWQQRVYERELTSFRAYLFVAVRNRALNYLKYELMHGASTTPLHQHSKGDSEVPEPLFTPLSMPTSSAPTPEELAEYEEVRFRIEAGIESLSAQCKKVFFMSRFEGKKNAAIAEELKISVRAVEAHITKALQTLKRLLHKYGLLALLICLKICSSV
jgi:RNA polymerase sigma-70 factor (ECF subfamily)